nr:hypothetical protein [Sphingobacterium sp. E70]
MRGIYNTIASKRLQYKKEYFIRVALVTLESNKPAKNGYMVRVKPMRSCSILSVQPPLTSPLGLVMARWARATAEISTKIARAVFDSFRMPIA